MCGRNVTILKRMLTCVQSIEEGLLDREVSVVKCEQTAHFDERFKAYAVMGQGKEAVRITRTEVQEPLEDATWKMTKYMAHGMQSLVQQRRMADNNKFVLTTEDMGWVSYSWTSI